MGSDSETENRQNEPGKPDNQTEPTRKTDPSAATEKAIGGAKQPAGIKLAPPRTEKTSNAKSAKPPRKGGALRPVAALLALATLSFAGYLGYIRYFEGKDVRQYLPWSMPSLHEQPVQPAASKPAVQASDTEPVEQLTGKELPGMQEKLDRLDRRIAEYESRKPPSIAAIEQQLQRVIELQNHQAKRLQDLSTTDRGDWLLAEVEFLLRLANQRLLTERNARNSLALMIQADAILRDQRDIDLFAVRKILVEDIAALRMLKEIDREGIYLEIDALAKAAEKLQIVIRPTEAEVADGQNGYSLPDTDVRRNWLEHLKSNLHRALGKVRDMVRIRRRNAPVVPLLGPEEELYLRANLQLLLEQAGLALMREEDEIYRHSLTRAAEWIRTHFEQDKAAAPMASRLEELAGIQIVQDLPDISGSLNALLDYIELRHAKAESSSGEAQ